LFTGGSSYGSYEARGVDLVGHVRVVARSAGGFTLHGASRNGRWLLTRDDRAIGIRGRGPDRQAGPNRFSMATGQVLSGGRTMLFTEVSASVAGTATCAQPTDRPWYGEVWPRISRPMASGRWPSRSAAAGGHVPHRQRRNARSAGAWSLRLATFFPDERILVCGNEVEAAAATSRIAGGAPRAVISTFFRIRSFCFLSRRAPGAPPFAGFPSLMSLWNNGWSRRGFRAMPSISETSWAK
jgi:hypothetical protein